MSNHPEKDTMGRMVIPDDKCNQSASTTSSFWLASTVSQMRNIRTNIVSSILSTTLSCLKMESKQTAILSFMTESDSCITIMEMMPVTKVNRHFNHHATKETIRYLHSILHKYMKLTNKSVSKVKLHNSIAKLEGCNVSFKTKNCIILLQY